MSCFASRKPLQGHFIIPTRCPKNLWAFLTHFAIHPMSCEVQTSSPHSSQHWRACYLEEASRLPTNSCSAHEKPLDKVPLQLWSSKAPVESDANPWLWILCLSRNLKQVFGLFEKMQRNWPLLWCPVPNPSGKNYKTSSSSAQDQKNTCSTTRRNFTHRITSCVPPRFSCTLGTNGQCNIFLVGTLHRKHQDLN